jgi:hypothetical protein
MASGKQDFMNAIRNGDVEYVRSRLRRYPGDLTEKLAWDSYDGFPLNYAAFCNQPKIIRLLIGEFGADPNEYRGVGSNWAPLNHARKQTAYAAAATLLSLGADPSRAASEVNELVDFCKSREVQQRLDPDLEAREKKIEQEQLEKRIAGNWKRTGAREITHEYEQPAIGCRLLDIFNFETRCLRSLVKMTDGPAIAQNILFFDDMPDTEILRQPAEKLRALGGEVSDEDLGGRPLLKKSFLSRPAR